MSPVAIRLLQYHKAKPERAAFPMEEMEREKISLGEMGAAYHELLERGFVAESGQHTSVTRDIARRCFKITQAGMNAQPVRENQGHGTSSWTV